MWHWGVNTMPLLGGGTEPRGEAGSFEAALAAFQTRHAGLPPGK